MKLQYYLKSDQGKLPKNEDAIGYFSTKTTASFIVCDGVGGYGFGDVASKFVAENMLTKLKYHNLSKRDFFLQCHNEFQKFKQKNDYPKRMSSTVLNAFFNEKLTITWSGDCRIYRLRKNHFMQLNSDHSLLMKYYLQNKLERNEFLSFPMKNIISSAIGLDEGLKIEETILPYKKNDLFLLCSDGLTDWVAETKIYEILIQKISLAEKGKQLFHTAINKNSKDNISIILVEIENAD